jgi:hypothetical protein
MSIYNHFQSLALAVSKGHKAQRAREVLSEAARYVRA